MLFSSPFFLCLCFSAERPVFRCLVFPSRGTGFFLVFGPYTPTNDLDQGKIHVKIFVRQVDHFCDLQEYNSFREILSADISILRQISLTALLCPSHFCLPERGARNILDKPDIRYLDVIRQRHNDSPFFKSQKRRKEIPCHTRLKNKLFLCKCIKRVQSVL